MQALDAADQADDKPTFEMAPLEEILIGEGVRCKTLLREQDHWLVQVTAAFEPCLAFRTGRRASVWGT